MDDLILKCFIRANSSIIFGLIFAGLFMNGAFGVTDEMKSVSVMEGDSVTLYTNATEIQKAELITWTFGSDRTRIAQINRSNNKVSLYDDALDGRFRDRLKLDDQTGSLTITNTTTEHTGLYEQQTFGGDEAPPQRFSVTIFVPLPIPVIIRNCSLSSSCSVVCSVVNVSHVTLSWLKGNSLLSSISASDLSIGLSLPLEVEDEEKNTYSCEINNPITHQTTHLDISAVCQKCEGHDWSAVYFAVICVCALLLAFVFFLCGVYCYHKWRRSKPADKGDQVDGQELACLKDGVVIEKDEIQFVSATVGESVTLQTDLTDIQGNELIHWKFAFSNKRNQGEFVVIAKWDQTNNEEYIYSEQQFKDRLKLDHSTGSLTITNIKPKHYGHYKLHISSEGHNITRTLIIVGHLSRKREGTIERRQTSP